MDSAIEADLRRTIGRLRIWLAVLAILLVFMSTGVVVCAIVFSRTSPGTCHPHTALQNSIDDPLASLPSFSSQDPDVLIQEADLILYCKHVREGSVIHSVPERILLRRPNANLVVRLGEYDKKDDMKIETNSLYGQGRVTFIITGNGGTELSLPVYNGNLEALNQMPLSNLLEKIEIASQALQGIGADAPAR